MKIKAPVFGMDRLKLTFKSNRQILKLFLKCCSASRYFCFALGNGRLLGLVLGSFFRVSQKYSVESIILTQKNRPKAVAKLTGNIVLLLKSCLIKL